MAYGTTIPATAIPSTLGGIAGLWGRMRDLVGRPGAAPAKQLTITPETERDLDRLDEHHLRDAGLCRKPRKTEWLDLGRGMPPVPTVRYDYFRIK